MPSCESLMHQLIQGSESCLIVHLFPIGAWHGIAQHNYCITVYKCISQQCESQMSCLYENRECTRLLTVGSIGCVTKNCYTARITLLFSSTLKINIFLPLQSCLAFATGTL